MAESTYVVTIDIAVPVEETGDAGNNDERERVTRAIGDAVFSVIAQTDPRGRIFNFAQLPAGYSVGDPSNLDVSLRGVRRL